MTEFEKSQCGLPYKFGDEIMGMFHCVFKLTYAYNQTDEDETIKWREM